MSQPNKYSAAIFMTLQLAVMVAGVWFAISKVWPVAGGFALLYLAMMYVSHKYNLDEYT